MLKIGTVKWQGKCAKHPMFNPDSDGAGAIKAGCQRCGALQSIYESHQRTLRMMRTFGPGQERRRVERPDPDRQRQQDLFSPNL